jgi:hypothetical protein
MANQKLHGALDESASERGSSQLVTTWRKSTSIPPSTVLPFSTPLPFPLHPLSFFLLCFIPFLPV